MKSLLAMLLVFSSLSAFAANNKSCGVRETAASLATIDMELDLLSSGLYERVRAESMRKIASIIKGHLLRAQTCEAQSESLKQTAVDTIDQLIMNNPNYNDYSLGTAARIFSTIRSSVSRMDAVSSEYLNDLIIRANP